MKSIKNRCTFLGLSIVMLLTSCNDFLSVRPARDGVLPENISELQAFYNTYRRYDNTYYRTFISDDCTVPFTAQDVVDYAGAYQKRLFEIRPAFFRRDLRVDNTTGGKLLWDGSFGVVTESNYILSIADDPKIKGTEQERKMLKAFARFERANSYFSLITSFCLPYAPGENDNGLGLPIRTAFNSEINESNLKRRTLKEGYDFIEQDLLAAMADIPESNVVYKMTKGGVHAFAARFYLQIGKYDEALKYANLALQHNSNLVDYTGFTTVQISQNGGMLNVLPYFNNVTFSNEYSVKQLKEIFYVDMFNTTGKPVFPTDALLALYTPNDIRLLNYPEEGGALASTYLNVTSTKKYRYYLGYGQAGGMMVTSPDVPEMVLIKAECLAEQDKLAEAKVELNRLRVKRIKNYDPSSVDLLANKDAVLDFIYDERRRERPFYLRGLDLRRLNAIKKKNIEVVKSFFDMTLTEIVPTKPMTYRLAPNDNAYADFIYSRDIALSEGILEQNP